MRSAGIVLILSGAFLIYAVVHSKLASQQPQPSPPSGSGDGSSGGDGGGDIGTHQGLNAEGIVYTISKAYKDMTDTEKDDANRFAHAMGN